MDSHTSKETKKGEEGGGGEPMSINLKDIYLYELLLQLVRGYYNKLGTSGQSELRSQQHRFGIK